MGLALLHEVPAGAIETTFNGDENPLFMRTHVGAILGLPQIYKSLENLDECEILTNKKGKSLKQPRALLWLGKYFNHGTWLVNILFAISVCEILLVNILPTSHET